MFRPVTVLKGMLSLPGGPGRLRNGMVVLQFGVLVALIVSTITIHRQTRFALDDQLRVPGDETYVMRVPCVAQFGFRSIFRDVARQIPGVRQAACASDSALQDDRGGAIFKLPDGRTPNLNPGHVDIDFFDVFGVEPLAGRLFDDRYGEDLIATDPTATANSSIILNESGARALGYANPRDALGKTHSWLRLGPQPGNNGGIPPEPQPSQVVGIVPDFTIGSVRNAIEPTVYYIQPQASFALVLKLDGQKIPDTMRALEAEWKKAASGGPLVGQFMSQILNEQYADHCCPNWPELGMVTAVLPA
jgi:putative ABC transport system permease protein